MRLNLSSLHLRVAEWILNRGDAACIYDVAQQFGVTVHQAAGVLSSVVTDAAIETQTGLTIPNRPKGRYRSKYVRSVLVLSIDYETIRGRKTKYRHHNYYARSNQPETCGEMSRAEKWDWLIRNARRRKR